MALASVGEISLKLILIYKERKFSGWSTRKCKAFIFPPSLELKTFSGYPMHGFTGKTIVFLGFDENGREFIRIYSIIIKIMDHQPTMKCLNPLRALVLMFLIEGCLVMFILKYLKFDLLIHLLPPLAHNRPHPKKISRARRAIL